METISDNSSTEKKYPYDSTDGFIVESAEDDSLGIQTKYYDNGGITKRATLSTGKVALARRLKGKDMKAIQRIAGTDKEKYADAIITMCVTIDDKPIVIEEIGEMWLNDTTTLLAMSAINF